MTLEDFLSKGEIVTRRNVYLPRLDITFKMKSLSAREAMEIRKRIMRENMDRNPQNVINSMVTDWEDIQLKQVIQSITEPNLLDERLMSKLHVNSPEGVLMELLRDGEYELLVRTMNELSMKNVTVTESSIQEAKNLLSTIQ